MGRGAYRRLVHWSAGEVMIASKSGVTKGKIIHAVFEKIESMFFVASFFFFFFMFYFGTTYGRKGEREDNQRYNLEKYAKNG